MSENVTINLYDWKTEDIELLHKILDKIDLDWSETQRTESRKCN